MAPAPDDEPARAAIVRAMRRIAVIGIKDADRDADAPAATIPALLSDMGLDVIGINPRVPTALGRPTLASLAQVPAGVDVLLVFRRSDAIGAIAADVLALPPDRRPGSVWLQSGIRDDHAASRLAAEGIPVVQDACLGVYARRYLR